MNKPKVAVGLCTYNNEDTIEETLSTLVNQTVKPDLIIICDKSSDKTFNKLQYFSKNSEIPIKIILQKGDGVASAYQEIYHELKKTNEYDIFATLQTDWKVKSDWLESHLKERERFPSCESVSVTKNIKESYIVKSIKDPGFFTGVNMSINMSALDKVNGWDVNFLRGEDWDIGIRLYYAGVVALRSNKPISERIKDDEPYISLSKAKRKPTSLTFLAKYGRFYLKLNPEHVIGDIVSLSFWMLLILFPIAILINLAYKVLLAVLVAIISIYILRLKIEGNSTNLALRRLILNGVAVPFALRRLLRRDPWNMRGFK